MSHRRHHATRSSAPPPSAAGSTTSTTNGNTRSARLAQDLATVLGDTPESQREALVAALKGIAAARRDAEAESRRTGVPTAMLVADGRLNDAIRQLGEYAPELYQHPNALTQLDSIVQRAYATADALGSYVGGGGGGNGGTGGRIPYAGASTSPTGLAAYGVHDVAGRPSGARGQSTNSGYGYAFTADSDRNRPVGVPDARQLRAWADSVPWLRAAITVRKDQVAATGMESGPGDPERKFAKPIAQRLDWLISQPNRLRQNPAEFWGSVVEDMLVLDRGVVEKVQDVARKPTELYVLNAAGLKIYPQWDGSDPDSPRYLFEDPDAQAGTSKVPLRNDECVVLMMNAASYRFGLSNVAVLVNEIVADIAAMQAARKAVSLRPPPHLINIPGYGRVVLQEMARDIEADYLGKKDLLFLGADTDKPLQAISLAMDPKNSQFLELQIYLARKVCAVMRISPQQVGITFDINKANGETQADISEDTGLIPLLLWIEWYANREIVADFAPKRDGWRSDLDALNIRLFYPQISEAQRILHYKDVAGVLSTALAGMPYMTLNQALITLGEETMPGGNRIYVDSKDGPIPWLGYESDTGDYNPPSASSPDLGGQDAAGGPNLDEKPQGSDESSGNGPTPAPDADDAPANPQAGGQAGGQSPAAPATAPSPAPEAPATGGGASGTAGAAGGKAGVAPVTKTLDGRDGPPRHTPRHTARVARRQFDTRQPGRAWRPRLVIPTGQYASAQASAQAEDDDHADGKQPPKALGKASAAAIRKYGAQPHARVQARNDLEQQVKSMLAEMADRGGREGKERAG